MPSGGQLSSVGRPSALRNQLKLRAESRRQRKPALVFVCVKALGAVYKIALEEKKRKKPPDDRRHQKSGFPVGMYTGPYFESPAQTHGKFSLFHSHFGDIAHDAPRRINSTLSGLIRRDSNPETPSSSQAVASRLGCHAHKSETQPGTASPAIVYYPR